MKKLDMKAFVCSGFDIEQGISRGYWDIVGDYRPEFDSNYYFDTYQRPRLNKPQVIDDYSKVLIDGLVWNFSYLHKSHAGLITNHESVSKDILEILTMEKYQPISLECIGIEDKPEWHQEAKRLSMPLIRV